MMSDTQEKVRHCWEFPVNFIRKEQHHRLTMTMWLHVLGRLQVSCVC